MAGGAGCGDAGLDVGGVGGGVEIFEVAGDAVGGGIVEVAADVTGVAHHGNVRPGQGEDRLVVVEGRRGPGGGGVAGGAGGGESASDVVGIRRAVEILDVAGGAVGWCAREFVSDVAGDAIQSCVRPRERIPSELEVIEFCPYPVVHQMAGFARRRKIHRQVTGIVRLLKLLQVAGRTRRGQSLELPHRRSLVARLALHRGVRTDQREAVLVLADGLRRDLPAADRMASRAVGSHLSAVKVRVTIRAVLPHIGEDGLDVALRAGDIYVKAAEGIAR